MKKQSAKDRREERESSRFYEEPVPIDPLQVSTSVLNALGHLGAQRFALPPFSEHFDRWTKDVRAVLAEMQTSLPEAADQTYREESERILTNVQQALRTRTEAEQQGSEEISKLQQELVSCDLELSNLEREYKTQVHETRKGHEHSMEKLKDEIDSLDKHRLKLLHKQPSLIDRILHRPSTKLEESAHALEVKRNAIGSKQTTMKQELTKLRANYDSSRKRLTERQTSLRAQFAALKTTTPDDALDLRNQACQELARAVSEAIGRTPQEKTVADAENIQ